MDRFNFFNELRKSDSGMQYLDLIEQARTVAYINSEEPKEIHHIYPRSFEEGRVDSEDNLVNLTVFDHIFAHYLLAKAIPCVSTNYAFRMMCDLHIGKLPDNLQDIILKLKDCARLRREGRVKTEQMIEKQRQNALGRVVISRGLEERKVYPEELEQFIATGWKRKRATKPYNPSEGKRWINDGNRSMLVSPEELNNYLQSGWYPGRCKGETTAGKVRMHKDGKVKYSTLENVDSMLSKGYVLGAPRGRKRTVDSNGKVHFTF